MIHKTEYIEWKNHPVTEALFADTNTDLQDIQEVLIQGEVDNPSSVALNIGIIRALTGIMKWTPKFDDNGYMLDINGKVIE